MYLLEPERLNHGISIQLSDSFQKMHKSENKMS